MHPTFWPVALQLLTVVFMAGVVVQQGRTNTQRMADATERLAAHEKAIAASEMDRARITTLLNSVAHTVERVERRLDEHERNSPCAEHTTLLKVFREELARIRDSEEQ